MTPTELIDKVRFEIKDDDDTNGYRFSRLDFEMWIGDAVREIYRKRPDVRLNSEFEMDNFTALYDYQDSGYYLSGYDDIIGWDKVVYSVLDFRVDVDNVLTASSGGADLFTVSFTEPFQLARIVPEAGFEFGGLVYVEAACPSGTSFSVSAVEYDIPVDYFVERALVFYLAYSAFSVDNEDTFNNGRASEYYQKFKGELGVA